MKISGALSLLLVLLAPAALAQECGDGAAASALPTALLGSSWTGTFHSFAGTGSIHLRFLDHVSASGEIPYFHKVGKDGLLDDALGLVDGPCEFTPRFLQLSPAEIHIYSCAKDAAAEERLSQDPARKPNLTVKVTEVQLDDTAEHLHIRVLVGPVKVDYELTREAP